MTLSTSDTDSVLYRGAKTALIYLLAAVLCGVFGWIYEQFSHGVYSAHMVYAFAYPLVGGALPFLALGLSRLPNLPGQPEQVLYHCGIATLTLGSVLRGVLEIYGTDNPLLAVYPIAGWLLAGIGAAVWFIDTFLRKKR